MRSFATTNRYTSYMDKFAMPVNSLGHIGCIHVHWSKKQRMKRAKFRVYHNEKRGGCRAAARVELLQVPIPRQCYRSLRTSCRASTVQRLHRLAREISRHSRMYLTSPQEIERCQREAQEEVEMATKYLEGVQAHRTLHPIRKVPPPPQVKHTAPDRLSSSVHVCITLQAEE